MTDEGKAPLLAAKILTVSDGVVAGTRADTSGLRLAEAVEAAGFEVVDRRVVADGREVVAKALRELTAGFEGIVVTTGGTGFAPTDETPEGTRLVIEREAPGLAEAMRLVNPLGRLSRAVAGVAARTIILNTPGSPKGAVVCFEAVADVVPNALALVCERPTSH